MSKPKVYIAGPYTKGDTEQNVLHAMILSDLLLDLGFHPYCPHLCHYQDQRFPQSYDVWLELVMAYMECCDAVLRFSGESEGADKEVIRATELEIPVFYSVKDLIKEFNKIIFIK